MIKKLLVGVFTLYLLVGFFVAPALVKRYLPATLEANIDAKVSLEDATFNPLIFKLTLHNLTITKSNDTPLSFGAIVVNVDPLSLLFGQIHIANIGLIDPSIHIALLQDKHLNLSSLLKAKKSASKEQKEQNSSLPNLLLEHFFVQNATIVYDDFTKNKPFRFDLKNISFDLTNITTKEDENATLSVDTDVGVDGHLLLRAKITSLAPLTLQAKLKLQANQLYEEWKYIQEYVNFEVADGRFSFETNIALNQNELQNLKLFQTKLQLLNLRIKPKGGTQDFITLKSFRIEDATILPLKQKVAIKEIALDGLDAKVKRQKDGKINWQHYFTTTFAKSKTKSKEPQKPWSVAIEQIALQNISAKFHDSFIAPSVTTSLDNFEVLIKDFELASSKPFYLSASMQLNQLLRCQAKATIIQKDFDISSMLRCSSFDITHYNPYIDDFARKNFKQFDIDLKSAKADIALKAHIFDKNATLVTQLYDTNATLKSFDIWQKSKQKRVFALKSFSIKNLSFNTKTKELLVENVTLNQPKLYATKQKDGVDLATLVAPKETKKQKKSTKTKPYHFMLKQFAIKDANLVFSDASLLKKVEVKITPLNLLAKDIDSRKKSWLWCKLEAKINNKADLEVVSKVRHTPLKAKVDMRLKDLYLADFSPYIEEQSYLELFDGSVSANISATYAPSKNLPDLSAKADVSINDFTLVHSLNKRHLLQFATLNLHDAIFALNPNRVYIDEVDIDALYVDAYIDANKTINFAKILKPTKKQKSSKKANSKPFDFQIAKVGITNSSATFEDASLPVRFKTEIHDLKGAIYAISNAREEISYVDIAGGVDKYGSMKLQGSIQSAAPKNYTDLALRFRNLNLSALSGYSAQFAGYKIAKGKLFVDLNYKINNALMQGKNSILIKNIELGDEIEDENISKLPLGLAIALLEDSNGVIDLNVPVEGDINNPDFKYGKLVFKAFVNLITKAVTAPFRFLGEALGIDTQKLKSIEFEYASSTLLPSEIEKLDELATLMIKRPKIALIFTPSYHEIYDTKAIAMQKLIQKLLKESKISSKEDLKNSLTVELLEDIYLQTAKEQTLQALQRKLQKSYAKEEDFAREYRKALLQKVLAMQVVTKEELEALATKRAQSVISYLVDTKGISPKRVKSKEIEILEDEGEFVSMQVAIDVAK